MSERHQAIAAAYLLLHNTEGATLMLRRANSGYCDGQLGLPAGHVEEGESVVGGMVREAREELGIDVDPADLTFVHVCDRKASDGHRLDFFFRCTRWQGEPVIMEPHKATEMRWVHDVLHEPDAIAYIQTTIECVQQGVTYSTENWP